MYRGYEDDEDMEEEQEDEYHGDMVNGKREGHGTMNYTNQDQYVGEWHNNKREGMGRFYSAMQYEYTGGWKADKKEGHGTMIWETEADDSRVRYIGEFHQDVMQGHGMVEYFNGDRYEGEFYLSMPHGKGKFFFNQEDYSRSVYEGDMKEGRIEGHGVLTYIDGDRYEGEFLEGLCHGIGKTTYMSGGYYEGEHKHGLLDGRGVEVDEIGDRYEGEWHDGVKEGRGKMVYANGDQYDGEWHGGEKEGRGVMVYANGDRFEGKWMNGLRNGPGVMYSDGEHREGVWVNDMDQEMVRQYNTLVEVKLDEPIKNTAYTYLDLYHDLRSEGKCTDVYSCWSAIHDKQHIFNEMYRMMNVDSQRYIRGESEPAFYMMNFVEFLFDKALLSNNPNISNKLKLDHMLRSLSETVRSVVSYSPNTTITDKTGTRLKNPYNDEEMIIPTFFRCIESFMALFPVSIQVAWVETYLTAFIEAYDLTICEFPMMTLVFGDEQLGPKRYPSCYLGAMYHTLLSLYNVLFQTHSDPRVGQTKQRSEIITILSSELQQYQQRHPVPDNISEFIEYANRFRDHIMRETQLGNIDNEINEVVVSMLYDYDREDLVRQFGENYRERLRGMFGEHDMLNQLGRRVRRSRVRARAKHSRRVHRVRRMNSRKMARKMARKTKTKTKRVHFKKSVRKHKK